MTIPPEAFEGIAADEPDDFELVSALDIGRRGIVPVQWDIDGVLEARNGPALMTAAPERFKSWSAKCMALSIVTGHPLFGHFGVPKPRPYGVYLNLDAGRTATENRFARLGPELPGNLLVATWTEWDPDRFAHLLEQYAGGFVVLDCFSSVYVNGESRVDQGEAMRAFMQGLRRVYERTGCNGIVIDHAARTERVDDDNFSGSQQKKAAIRQGITLRRTPGDDEDGDASTRQRIRFGCLKMSEAEPFRAFDVEFSFVDGYLTTRFLGFVAGPQERRKQQLDCDVVAIANAIERAKEPLGQSALLLATGLRRDRFHAAVSDDRFQRVGGGRSTRYQLTSEVDK